MPLKHKVAYGALVSAALAATSASAAPAQTPSQQQVQMLQQQIQALQQQLQSLQSQVNFQAQVQAQVQSQAQVQAKAAPPANAPKVTMSASNRPGFSSADGQNTIELTSRLHLDAGDYLNVSPRGTAGPRSLNSGINVRRGRIGVLGKFLGDWNYALIYDFGGSNDSGAGGTNNAGLENALITYSGFRPIYIEGGYMDVPYTLDEATSSNDLMFMERATPQVIATNLASGDFRSAFGVRGNTDRLWVGGYLTGPQSGAIHSGNNQQQLGGVFRATYQVLQSDNYSVHIGVDGQKVFNSRNNANAPLGTPTGSGISVSDRPELRVDPTSLVGTGTIPAREATQYGFEVAGGWESLYLQGEYFHYSIDQIPAASNGGITPELNFDGGYVEAAYTITGEHRKYNPATGAYGSIVPAHPVGKDGGIGAWELALRFSAVDLNDHTRIGVLQSATGGFFGGKQQAFALGVNWYPISNIRFLFDYEHVDIDRLSGTTAGTPQIGTRLDWIATRAQVAF